jgi:hypothetical protein
VANQSSNLGGKTRIVQRCALTPEGQATLGVFASKIS